MGGGSWIRIGSMEAHLDAKTMNKIVEDVMGKRMQSVTKDPDLRHDIGEEFARIVTKYVPMKTGALRMSGRATDDGRLYWSAINPNNGYNYAQIQYENTAYKHKEPTCSHWVHQVQPKTDDWDNEFIPAITPIIKRRFNDG
jgi:hypothetical protein